MNVIALCRYSLLIGLLNTCNAWSGAISIAENGSVITVSGQSLRDAHANFKTQIVKQSLPEENEPLTPPEGVFSLISYPTSLGNMDAYVTPDPKDGKRHPAVIWIHGGYGGISDSDYFWQPQPRDNDQSGSAFRQAGLVLMIPSFRGEDHNPGKYEMFYGELEDIESAYNWLAKQPRVDPARIYLAGHSTGGTRVLLASEYGSQFRAYFSLGAIPDLKARVDLGDMSVPLPFAQNDQEFRLRSPAAFLTSIKKPTWYFEGEDNFWSAFKNVDAFAKAEHLPLTVTEISNGDHFSIIAPVTELIAQKINKDTGDSCNIQFSEAELRAIGQSLAQ
ncbi:alpha/beta hydrolase family protein [Atlantibacter hermannii]|uniref:alpha/beta hydrolase family protein n=1 Tax=Atlantibacter hermannii TaxID=565 RepID=UPI0034D657CF